MSEQLRVPGILLEFQTDEVGWYVCQIRGKRSLDVDEISRIGDVVLDYPDTASQWRQLLVGFFERSMRDAFGDRFIAVEEQLGSGVGDYYRFGLILKPRESNATKEETGGGGTGGNPLDSDSPHPAGD